MRHVLKMRDKKMKKVDLKGFETGRLKVVEKAGKDRNGRTLWRCACSCGNECFYITSRLTGGYVQSCGCLQRERAAESISIARDKLVHENRNGGKLKYEKIIFIKKRQNKLLCMPV